MADMALIEAVARENGIALYRLYTTEQAAGFVKKAPFTLKRWRRERNPILRVTRMEGRIYYLGIDIVQAMLGGREGMEADNGPTAPPGFPMAAE